MMAVPPLNDHIFQKYFAPVVTTCIGTLLSLEQIRRPQMCILMHPSAPPSSTTYFYMGMCCYVYYNLHWWKSHVDWSCQMKWNEVLCPDLQVIMLSCLWYDVGGRGEGGNGSNDTGQVIVELLAPLARNPVYYISSVK